MSTVDQALPTVATQPFRLDVPLHNLLQQPLPRPSLLSSKELVTLPDAVFPQHPELFHELDTTDIAAHDQVVQAGKRHWPASRILKTMRGWMVPDFKSPVFP